VGLEIGVLGKLASEREVGYHREVGLFQSHKTCHRSIYQGRVR
jgi:hypothetical protein